ncbi:hypothetical protein C2845_PM09G18530 [Panicum miliaceum]|uniref:Uncharacterized protein n=1 Tax=Panicum miliaceum TaxID=4540 RepID=A0A3L6S157_PANMI|nr:hypothetical protein C2845_PM09G18530 [Panicum miliaceum]
MGRHPWRRIAPRPSLAAVDSVLNFGGAGVEGEGAPPRTGGSTHRPPPLQALAAADCGPRGPHAAGQPRCRPSTPCSTSTAPAVGERGAASHWWSTRRPPPRRACAAAACGARGLHAAGLARCRPSPPAGHRGRHAAGGQRPDGHR